MIWLVHRVPSPAALLRSLAWRREHARLPTALPPEISPLDAALWLATEHVDALSGLECGDLRAWRARVGEMDAWRAEAVAQALFETWLGATRSRIAAQANVVPEGLKRASDAVADAFLTAHRVPFDSAPRRWAADALHPGFETGAPFRLLRGLSNCDGLSHTLARLVGPSQPTTVVRVHGHRLVRARPRAYGSSVYLDAFVPLPPFTLGRRQPGIACHAELIATHDARALGQRDGLLPALTYRAANPVAWILERPFRPWPSSLDPPRPPTRREPSGAWQAYLVARAHALFGDAADARAAYRRACALARARRGLEGIAAEASSAFLQRLG